LAKTFISPMKLQLGFVSAILDDLTLAEVFSFAQAERFSCVELMCWPAGKSERKFAGVTHIDVTKLSQSEAHDIRALAASHQVEISGLGYYPNLLDPNPEVSKLALAHLRKVIAAAPKL